MPSFSKSSAEKLATCHGALQVLFNKVIEEYDCTILEGFRSNEDQEEAFANRKSTVRGGDSKHNRSPSIAVDVAPYPVRWEDTNRFYHFAGYVKAVAESLNLRIRWGGDWNGNNEFNDQTFNDLVHFELL